MKNLHHLHCLVAFSLAVAVSSFASADVVINEFMSANGWTLVDEDGDNEDWVELRNVGDGVVEVSGWGLSDSLGNPFKWTFPENTVMQARSHLLVFASGKDRPAVAMGNYEPAWADGISGKAGLWLCEEPEGALEDSSGSGNAGVLLGGSRVRLGAASALKFGGVTTEYAQIPNSASLQITGSMTISMWLNPSSFAVRQNPWDKAYGGEGTITLETNGRLTFYWGTAGGNASPFQGFSSVASIEAGRWTHVAVVRDLGSRQLRWFFNGEQVSASSASFSAAVASTAPLRIGRGYAGPFNGMIGQPLVVAGALSASQVQGIYEATCGAFEPKPHTNFSLRRAGEPLVLTRADGVTADSLPAMPLPADVSYGRKGGSDNEWLFFDRPSPGSPNGSEGYTEYLHQTPEFSRQAGFYEDGFALQLSTDVPGAQIIYTIDGSTPDGANLEGNSYEFKNLFPRNPGEPLGAMLEASYRSHQYEGSIPVGDRSGDSNYLSARLTSVSGVYGDYIPDLPVSKGTVVRARLEKEGAFPGEVATHTYFVGPGMSQRYGLPVVSLSMDEDTLFDYEKGIYTAGKDYDDWRASSNEAWDPSRPANWLWKGDESEYPVTMEVFGPGTGRSLVQNLGFRMHGNWSRARPQKTFRLYAKEAYDERNEIEQAIFPGLVGSGTGLPITSFKRLLLRNAGNEPPFTMMRDACQQEIIRPMGLDQQAYQPAVHFINGEFWGIINFRERIDKYSISSHHGIDPERVVILGAHDGRIQEGTPADQADYQAMKAFITTEPMDDDEKFAVVESQMDTDNYILYHVAQIFCNNLDWPQNNVSYWRSATVGDAPTHDRRWRWILFDMDFGAMGVGQNALGRATGITDSSYDYAKVMLRKLLDNPGFRNRFINAFGDHLATTFNRTRTTAMVDAMAAAITPYFPEHKSRWRHLGGDYLADLRYYFVSQPSHARQHVISHFGLAGEAGVTLNVNDMAAGYVRINTIDIDHGTPGITSGAVYPWSASYFQGVPVTVTAVPREGFVFTGWSEHPGHESETITLDPTGGLHLTANFEPIPEPLVVHGWDFEGAAFAEPSATVGGGALAAELAGNAAWLRNTAAQDFPTAHLRVNNPLGAVLTFSVPTTGFEGITLDFETRRSGDGAGLQTLSYTLDGSVWTEHASYEVFDAAPQPRSFDFSGVAGVDDNPSFAVRISFSRTAAQIAAGVGLTGNNRFDNVMVRGYPLPGVNLPPVVVEMIGRREVAAGVEPLVIDLGVVFADPNPGDTLGYAVEIDPPGLAGAVVVGDTLTIAGSGAGNAVVTVSASDGENAPVATSFPLLVYPAPHGVAGGDFLWREWSAQEPAGSFPAHMVFLQGEGNNDSTLTTALTRAYEIPPADAASPEDVDFPYAASSRTRINGLGAGGVALINTGRGRDLGAALLALDTRGVTAVRVSWVAGTVVPNTRVYALRLQAREGVAGAFQDVLIGGQPVEYVRNATAGHQQVFGPVELPVELLGKENLQLQWRYYLVSGSSGARAQLSLDDVVVTAGAGPRNYASWRLAEYPGLGERDDDAVSGPLAMSGELSNLLRYALGLGRHEDVRERMPRTSEDGGFAIRFPFDPAKGDIRYRVLRQVELSGEPTLWFDSGRDPWQEHLNDGWLTLPEPEDPVLQRAFYRLEVVR